MKTVNLPSVFFSKDHFNHANYLEKNNTKVNISSKDLDHIRKISIIVGLFTLGIGGVLCYYVWTAKKKVDLFNQLEKSGPSKIVETGKKVKQASETLQTHTERPQKNLVNVDELLNQIKEHPGYKPEWKNISSATLHANFMQAPVNSYCIIPEEGLGSEEKVFRLIKVVEKDHKKILEVQNFALTDEGVSFYYGFSNSDSSSSFDPTLPEFLKKLNLGQPLSSINEHVRTDLHSDYSTEDLKQQIENDPGFLSEIPQDHFSKLLNEKAVGTYYLCRDEKDPRENLYYVVVKKKRTTDRSNFWISEKGFLPHTSVYVKNAEEQIYGLPNLAGIGNLKDFLKQQGALYPVQNENIT